jgi:hypothetical protein
MAIDKRVSQFIYENKGEKTPDASSSFLRDVVKFMDGRIEFENDGKTIEEIFIEYIRSKGFKM